MGLLSSLFGKKNKPDIAELLHEGAIILDVRTPSEFQSGHIKGAINIPLDQLSSKLSKLKKDTAIITCCASGMRSGAAKSLLAGKGFNAVNGGSWMSLRKFKS